MEVMNYNRCRPESQALNGQLSTPSYHDGITAGGVG